MNPKSETEKQYLIVEALCVKSERLRNYDDKSFGRLCDFAAEVSDKTGYQNVDDGLIKLQFIKQKLERHRDIKSSHKSDVFNEELADLKMWLLTKRTALLEKMNTEENNLKPPSE